jgi:hypothetical protein
MRLRARLDRLEHIAPEPVAMPADPPTQVVARELLDRDDASPEGRETALRFLAGEYD